MKKRIVFRIIAAAALLLVVTAALCLWIEEKTIQGQSPPMEDAPENTFAETITVVADQDYDPYSFYGKDGQPSGHNVELLYELARRMKVNVELRLLPWSQAVQSVINGDADIILGVSYATIPNEYFSMSMPIISDPCVAFGRGSFSSVVDLYGKKLAVLENTSIVENFIRAFEFEADTACYSSISEAFAALERGDCDYVLTRYSVGRRYIAKMKDLTLIKAVGPTLVNNFSCVGVSNGSTQLLERLNSAIISMGRDGTTDALSDKWLGNYVQVFSIWEYIDLHRHAIALFIAVFCLICIVIFSIGDHILSARRENALRFKAERDQLTGLYNRATCEALIKELLRSSGPEERHTLFLMDMDNFKSVNDNLGHMQGDEALKSVATALTRLFRADDVIGRLGGDEFFVFMRGCAKPEMVEEKAHLICAAFTRQYKNGEYPFKTSASVGAAVFPDCGVDFYELYQNADAALYFSKKHGKSGYTIFSPSGDHIHKMYVD